jgi:peptidoglycan/LPS O-acetylase OafA/YrhL
MQPARPRFPLIDSARGIAAITVLLYHVGLVGAYARHGELRSLSDALWIGVPVFFVISGFLLYRPFAAAARGGGKPVDVGRYGLGRFLRIAPAYWAALTFFALTTGLHGVLTGDWWKYYGFLQVYSDDTLLGGMAVAWTLCVEVTFYIALPLYAVASRRLSLRGEYLMLAALAALSFGFRALTIHDHWGNTLPASFVWFIPGMVLALWTVQPPRFVGWLTARSSALWALAAVLVVVAGHCTVLASNALMLVAAPLILLPALAPDASSLPGRVLSLRPLLWLGTVSYGIYLYHVTLMAWLVDHHGASLGPSPWLSLAAVTLVVTITAAAASWYLLEEPALRLKNAPLPWRRRAAAAPAPTPAPAPAPVAPEPATVGAER